MSEVFSLREFFRVNINKISSPSASGATHRASDGQCFGKLFNVIAVSECEMSQTFARKIFLVSTRNDSSEN